MTGDVMFHEFVKKPVEAQENNTPKSEEDEVKEEIKIETPAKKTRKRKSTT